MATISLESTLIIHVIGAPLFFAVVSFFYFERFNYTTPLFTAAIFVVFVVMVDFFVVALMINQSLEMFTSLLGTRAQRTPLCFAPLRELSAELYNKM